MSVIDDYFATRHCGHRMQSHLVPRLSAVYQWFQDAGLNERKFENEVKQRRYDSYAQDVSEMLVAYRLHQDGFSLRRSHASGGPDFIARKDGISIQLEIVTPLPLPEVAAYLNRPKEGVFTVPMNEFLLCWTKGIAQKTHQLLGNGEMKGWMDKGLVDVSLPFVVVVNGCMYATPLSEGFGPPLGGFPWAAVALYAISDPTVYLDQSTGRRTGSGFEFRKQLDRTGKGSVPLDTFLDSTYQPISGVWAVALDDFDLLHDPPEVAPRRVHESALLHNPLANVSVPQGILPTFEDWVLHLAPATNTLERVVDRRRTN